MAVINLSDSVAVLGTFVAELRDVNVQKDPMRFGQNLKRPGPDDAGDLAFGEKI